VKCFECGTNEGIHHHHIVPRSLGGTQTIPLCFRCHGKVHSVAMSSSDLIKKGLSNAKKRGVRLGPPLGSSNKLGFRKSYDKGLITEIQKLSDTGITCRKIAELLGGIFDYVSPSTVNNIQRKHNIKNLNTIP